MSDHFVTFVPVDPQRVPDASRIAQAESLARRRFPDADDIAAITSPAVAFFDAGRNFESVQCPHCGASLDMDWWQERMDDDYVDRGFRLAAFLLPCCGATATLAGLRYDAPQAFARFGLQVRNADVGDIPPSTVDAFAEALGVDVHLVTCHH